MQEVRQCQEEMSPEQDIVVELEKENVSWAQQENAGFSLPEAALPYNLQPVSTASSGGETCLETCFRLLSIQVRHAQPACVLCFQAAFCKAAECARLSWQVQYACMCLMLQNHPSPG